MSDVTLVLGGARSGKSRHAEGLAAAARGAKVYIATAEAFDEEMRDRIARHQAQRGGAGWETIEAPLDLVPALKTIHSGVVLIDCVTLWISNLMHAERDVKAEVDRLCAALKASPARVVIVSNEVGLSIVPENALARRFRDEQGLANQAIAATADEVVLVAAGLPLFLKRRSRRIASRGTAGSSPGRRA
jgi:adenosylcobinamide kinase / adenosylcobinamide-phosphate guanylyltransferase